MTKKDYAVLVEWIVDHSFTTSYGDFGGAARLQAIAHDLAVSMAVKLAAHYDNFDKDKFIAAVDEKVRRFKV